MNPKYYNHKKYGSSIYKDSDSDEDDEFEVEEEDYLQGERDEEPNQDYENDNDNDNVSPYSYPYGKTSKSNPYATSGGISKYDIGNPANLMKTGFSSGNVGPPKYSSISSMDKKNAGNNNYDFYGGGAATSTAAYNLGSFGGSSNYGMRDSYNIDIDLNKIKKENEISKANVNAATKNFLTNKEKKPNSDKLDKLDIENTFNPFSISKTKPPHEDNTAQDHAAAKKNKKKRNFLDDLDEELDKEQKKEEEEFALEAMHRDEDEYSDAFVKDEPLEDRLDTTEKKDTSRDNKYNNFAYDEKEESHNISHYSQSIKSNRRKQIDKSTSKREVTISDAKDSTISIEKYMNNYNNEENDVKDKNIEEDDEDFSYNKISIDRDITIKNKVEAFPKDNKNVKDIKDVDKANNSEKQNINLNKSKSKSHSKISNNSGTDKSNLSHKEKVKRILKSENNYDNYDNYDKYDKSEDFVNNNDNEKSNKYNQINQNNSEDAYNKFDEDVVSNLAESNNDHHLNLVKTSLSNELKNMMSSSSGEILTKGKIKEKTTDQVNVNLKVEKENESLLANKRYALTNNVENNNPTTQNNFQINYNQEYIQNIIAEEFKKLLSSSGVNNLIKFESPVSNSLYKPFLENPTNIPSAKMEVQERLKSYLVENSDNFLIYSDSHNNLKSYNKKKLYIYQGDQLFIQRTLLPKKDLKEMKLQNSLDEERKRRDYFEISYNRLKETVEEYEQKLRKMKNLEIENKELQKLKYESDEKYKELENDLLNLKGDYEVKLKLMEERIVLRESKNETRKIVDLQRKFEIEIENMKMELNEKIADLNEYMNKCDFYEKENTKLNINKFANFETNDKIKELRNENFILHEKCNDLNNRFERLNLEKEKLEKKLLDKEFEEELNKDKSVVEPVKKKNNYASNNFINSNMGKSSYNSYNNPYASPYPNDKNQNSNNIFDQIMIEREQNVQEAIIKSYAKEIERLNNEIKLLKNITALGSKNNYQSKIIPSKTNTQFNNFLSPDSNSNQNFIKDSAEEKIRLLSKLLSGSIPDSNLSLKALENEFNILNCSGEIDLDSFLNIFQQKLNIPFSKYELIEIFNNFPRTSTNKIRYNDILNALRSKSPSTFFIQPDPSYLKEIEAKIITYENKIKDLEKFVEGYKNKENDLIKKIENLEKENQNLNTGLKMKNENSENLLSSLVKNNFLNGNNSTFNNQAVSDQLLEKIKKLKEKLKSLEQTNVINLKEFEKNISLYEEKFNKMKKDLELEGNNQNNNYSKEISVVKEENIVLKSKTNELELRYKNELSNLLEKISKYKKNQQIIKEKLFKSEKEKEKIIVTFSKSKNLDLNPSIIQNFIMNTEEVQQLTQKINELEKRNLEREDHYKQLCYNSNQYQTNKELESLNKKFETERKEFKKIINQKNTDILNIKREFEGIYRELEDLKYPKKTK